MLWGDKTIKMRMSGAQLITKISFSRQIEPQLLDRNSWSLRIGLGLPHLIGEVQKFHSPG